MLRLVTCGALLAATATATLNVQEPKEAAFSLTRQYGRALYRECRTDVTIVGGQGRAGLHCTLNREPPQSLATERALVAEELTAFGDLVARSELCGGGHIGKDTRAGDGFLETLMTECAGGSVAVLVTSGNPTFATEGARRQLLERIRSLEDELRKSASAPK